MKVTIIPIVIGAFGTVTKILLKGLEEVGGRVETIQTTELLRTARILRRVLETCFHSNSSERPSANADVKNSFIVRETVEIKDNQMEQKGKTYLKHFELIFVDTLNIVINF